jgi:hypothetical protein
MAASLASDSVAIDRTTDAAADANAKPKGDAASGAAKRTAPGGAPPVDAALVLRNLPADVPTHAKAQAAAEATSEAVLQQVRDCLIDTLRLDAPLYAAVTLVRVRRATQTKDLIELVWEIERYLGTTRKNHRELQSLHRARDLLGMGNTQFNIDTQPGFSDSQ